MLDRFKKIDIDNENFVTRYKKLTDQEKKQLNVCCCLNNEVLGQKVTH